MFVFTSNGWAVEPVYEQQALLYYQIPFGGIQKVDNTHKFGFRVDRITIDRTTGQYSDSASFYDLMKRPASLDFQMSHEGITTFKMHGYDYLPQLISKADEESGEGGEGVGEDGNASEPEAGDSEKAEEKEVLKFSDVMNQTSFGILLGGVIAVLAITGSGG